MAKKCPITGEKVVYLDCLECDDKRCYAGYQLAQDNPFFEVVPKETLIYYDGPVLRCRNLTDEEVEKYQEALDKVSKPTGFDCGDFLDNN